MSLEPRLAADDWLATFENEYLGDLLPQGGAAIRFVSGDAATLDHVSAELAVRAEAKGLLHRHLDPSRPAPSGKPWKLHLVEEFYRAAVADFDWLESVQGELRAYLQSRGLTVARERPLNDLAGIAQENDMELPALHQSLRGGYLNPFVTDKQMLSEFRLALMALSEDLLLEIPASPSATEIVATWLAGGVLTGGLAYLKGKGIYDRLKGTNARPMLVSFLRWLRRTRRAGLSVVLDLRPYEAKRLTKTERTRERDRRLMEGLRARRPHDEILAEFEREDAEPEIAFPDKPFLQMMDLLRHFLDDVETFPGFALVVLTSDRFYDVSQPRSYQTYNALNMRIAQEVRDARRANPVAILNHLEPVR